MQSRIPPKIREQLSDDPWMANCIFESSEYADRCGGRIQWHHAFTYAGKRVNELWAIQPLCEAHHKEESALRGLISLMVKMRISHFKDEENFRIKYPKSTLLDRPKNSLITS